MVAAFPDPPPPWRPSPHVAPSDDFVPFHRSSSSRPPSSFHLSHSSPLLRRQRTLSSFPMGCCLCGNKSLSSDDDLQPHSSLQDYLLCRGSSAPAASASASAAGEIPHQPQSSWWQESWRLLGSRRKPNNVTWADDAVVSDELYYKAPRWKMLLRKLRAQTRKMNCTKPSAPGFHYDPLSYAKNFDDGCWHQCDAHVQGFYPSRFSVPIVVDDDTLKANNSQDR